LTYPITEREFIEWIDAAFPYHRDLAWRAVVKLGASLTPNASFMVLHEICRLPYPRPVDLNRCLEMLAFWDANYDHPLKAFVFPAAKALVTDSDFSVDEAIAAMEQISVWPDQYCALSIPYFACDDVDGRADAVHERVLAEWAKSRR
jgi:hypothetical protein